MSRLLTMLLALIALPTELAAQLQPPGASDGVYATDEAGRTYRVAFGPHDRVWLEGGYEFGSEPTPQVAFGWSLKLDVDFPDEEIWWQIRQELALFEFRPDARSPLTLTALRGDYLRHDVSSSILIPRGKRDIRLPAPFDIAVIWSLVSADVAPRLSPNLTKVDVAHLAVLADLLRDEHYRHRLAIGASASYTASVGETQAWRHDVVPFAGATALWGWEHPRGLFTVMVRPTFARVAMIQAGDDIRWGWRASGEAEVEWVVVAINDAPLSLLGRGEVEFDLADAPTYRVGFGIRFSIPTGL